MRESELYQPVRAWLVDRGYEIHVELFGHDIVAVKDGRAVVVELKSCLSGVLMDQLRGAATWADEVMAAIASRPNCTKGLRYFGFGLLRVRNGKCFQQCKPKPQPWHRIKRRKYKMGILASRSPAMPHEVAGLKSCPELKQQRIMRGDHYSQMEDSQ